MLLAHRLLKVSFVADVSPILAEARRRRAARSIPSPPMAVQTTGRRRAKNAGGRRMSLARRHDRRAKSRGQLRPGLRVCLDCGSAAPTLKFIPIVVASPPICRRPPRRLWRGGRGPGAVLATALAERASAVHHVSSRSAAPPVHLELIDEIGESQGLLRQGLASHIVGVLSGRLGASD